MNRRRVLAASIAAALATIGAPTVRANDPKSWPTRPVRLVVPQAAGGSADLLGRFVAEGVEPILGVAMVVDNRPGANGLIGTDAVKRAAPDGYTLLIASTATHAMAPGTMAEVPFDPVRDFAGVINLAWQTKVVLVSSNLPATTLAELVAYARARPGALNYASTGIGSASHVDTELLAAATGMSLVHIPYRGSGQTVGALSADDVQVLLASVTAAYGAIRQGQVRALAVLSAHRSPLLPRVPTIAESGVSAPDVRTWLGVVAPVDTPPAVVATLNHAFAAVLADPAARSWLDGQGLEPIGGNAATFDATIRADVARWGGIVKRLGLRAS